VKSYLKDVLRSTFCVGKFKLKACNMITLISNIECYCPKYAGQRDILLVGDKIYKIGKPDSFREYAKVADFVPGNGLLAFPGILDGHVHITGGGGEAGFISRIAEIDIQDIIQAGITTVVGLLGADHLTRSLTGLLAKAKALEAQGITTYLYVGSYAVPIITFTSSITGDMVLIDKVIGVGEIAISDHRSSHPRMKELLQVATQAHLGGLISGKAGIVHFHVGDGKAGMGPLVELADASDLPIEQFVPTHVNRNPRLFQQALDYCRLGGYIDLTSGEEAGIKVPDAIQMLMENQVDLQKVTISSDANGSVPEGGIGEIQTLYDDIVECITGKQIPVETAFGMVTENVAKQLTLFPQKGVLSEGSDADILITDSDFTLRRLYGKGKLLINT